MGFSVTNDILIDGPRKLVMHFTGTYDGEGGQESGVAKVDVSALTPSCARVRVDKVTGNVNGGLVKMIWDDLEDSVPFAVLEGYQEMQPPGGFNNPVVGGSGDLLFTTEGFGAGSNYDLVIEMVKKS